MPLIRYRLGDRLQTREQDGLPVITAIRGRLDDWVILADGTRIPFHVFYEVMERRSEILQFRIIQERYDFIRVLCVLRNGCDAASVEQKIVADLNREVSNELSYTVDFVDSLPPDANGKLRMLVSKVMSE
jgi:phenylacetate-coenzyme A ligase PaaK-like adenylate-forming protein